MQIDEKEWPVTFTHPVEVKARRPNFTPFESVRMLDKKTLAAQPHAEIEVGFVGAGRSRRLVKAVVEKGSVTGLVTEPCTGGDEEGPPPGLVELMKEARRRLDDSESPVKFPMPIDDFVRETTAGDIRVITCYEICFTRLYCIVCCTSPGTDEIFYCGRSIVILG